ncbi:hypothetical protein GOODEAATRI_019476 [Goodea atripinnis]|uniref:Uncharacterized protein n=1 Tax=Goodea atripinnis TaxID=208336 RepID=A0ABV0PPZ6_9TELE
MNQELESTLRCLTTTNPTSWTEYLSWVEYAHNTRLLCYRGSGLPECCCPSETCEVWAKPSNLDSDYLYPQLQFVYLDYSSQDCGSVPNPPTPALVSTLADSGL